MKLVIGNKNYSTWSLRGWLVARLSGRPFAEVLIDLDAPDTAARIAEHSPAGRVPVLVDGPAVVWDSLAITEYLAETAPDAGIWPADPVARARARSIAAEMHAGFGALRSHYPMNIRRPVAVRAPTLEAAADMARISAIWRETRAAFGAGGPFLFGAFSAADAFFAPVASRLRTYAVPIGPVETAYVEALLAHPAMAEWIAAARAETWIVPSDEVD